jgi:hypothetical protein
MGRFDCIYVPPAWFHALIPTLSVMVTRHLSVHGLGFHPSGHSEMSRHSCIKSGNLDIAEKWLKITLLNIE